MLIILSINFLNITFLAILAWLHFIIVYYTDSFFIYYSQYMLPFHCSPFMEGFFVGLPLCTVVSSSLKHLLQYPLFLIKSKSLNKHILNMQDLICIYVKLISTSLFELLHYTLDALFTSFPMQQFFDFLTSANITL